MNVFIEAYERWKYSLLEVVRQIRNKPPRQPHKLPIWVWALVAAALVFVVCGLTFADEPLVRWAHSQVTVGSTEWKLLKLVTNLGLSSWILALSGVASLLLGLLAWRDLGRSKLAKYVHWHANANFIFFTIAVSGTIIYLVKNSIGRARPGLLAEFGPHHYDFFAFKSIYAAFPSGHATTFGAMCLGLALIFPRTRWLMLFIAIIGSFTRIILWKHYPSDVVAGLICGAAFTWYCASVLASRRIMFKPQEGFLPKRRLL